MHLIQFYNWNIHTLNVKENAFFSVNVVARKPEKSAPETNPYLIKFLGKIKWKPKNLGVFAGKIEYPKYKFIDKYEIKFIMLAQQTNLKCVLSFGNNGKVYNWINLNF